MMKENLVPKKFNRSKSLVFIDSITADVLLHSLQSSRTMKEKYFARGNVKDKCKFSIWMYSHLGYISVEQ